MGNPRDGCQEASELDVRRKRFLWSVISKLSSDDREKLHNSPAWKAIVRLMDLDGDTPDFQSKLMAFLDICLKNATASLGIKEIPSKIDITPEERVRLIHGQAVELGWTDRELLGKDNSLLSILQVRDEIINVEREAITIRHAQQSEVKFYRTPTAQAEVRDGEVREMRSE